VRDFALTRECIERDGFATVDDFASGFVVDELKASINGLGDRAGTRQLHRAVPAVAEFLAGDALREWIQALVPGGFPVRTIFFDKTPTANWKVPWHQDLTICVRERHEVPGFSGWSVKEGVVHVQPPVEVLNRMVTIRLHLDDCGPENGPLRVLPGSHRGGRLGPDAIARWQVMREPVTCVAPRAAAVIMKPLILHGSSAAKKPEHRRVLHIEIAAESLPAPLEWAM